MEKAKQKLNAKPPYRGAVDRDGEGPLYSVGCLAAFVVSAVVWAFLIWTIWRPL